MTQTLWNMKSSFYQFARNLPFLKWILDAERRNIADLVSQIQSPPERTLDIGSGAGSTLDLLPDALSMIVTDMSSAMLHKLNKKSPCALSVCSDGLNLPFPDQTFGFVSCIGVSEYIEDKERLVREISRLMKSHGFLLITIAQPNLFNFLRLFLGHRLYLIRPKNWEKLICEKNIRILQCQKSLMQTQYLCKKQ